MQESRLDGRVEDINGEVYHSLCSLRSASEVLRELRYASIKETCVECFKAIELSAKPLTCASCQRGCHIACLEGLSNRHYLARRKITSTQFECEWCIDINRCLQCKNGLDACDIKTHSCSICLRKTHTRCHKVPFVLMEPENNQSFPHLKQSIVCGSCLSRFGIREAVDHRECDGKEYFLVRVDHPSPIHLTWVQEKLLSPSLRSSEGLLVNSPPEIEAIFSMHVPRQHQCLNIDQIEHLLGDLDLCVSGKGFMFLTKWRHAQAGLVWEDSLVFQQQRSHISKFLHQLKMNLLSIHQELPPTILQSYFSHCITTYALKLGENIFAINSSFKTEGEAAKAQHIYRMYSNKFKQFVNIPQTGERAEAICYLIKNIYFLDKCPLPIVILTDQAKISTWTASILKNLPQLILLSLEGASGIIEEVVRHRLLAKQGKGRLFRFNVLIISYQNLRAIGSLFDFRHALEDFTLMVMDEKMPPLARYYYTNVKIARIKFHKDQKQPVSATNPTEKHEVTSSDVTSSQKKSSMTLSSSHNLKLYLEKCNIDGQRLQPKSFIDILYQEFAEGFHLTHSALTARLPNQLQRLVFLRYVLACGLNSFKKEVIYEQMIKLQSSCFSEPKETAMAKLQVYLSYFLAHVSRHKGYITPEIKQFFFFTVQRRLIFKTINDHTRLKHYCQLFEKDPHIQLILPPPTILIEKQEVKLVRWEGKFDYFICRGVLNRGTNDWETISECTEDWKNNGQPLPFRSYLCQALAISTFRLYFFCDFLKARVHRILFALEKRFG